MPSSGGDRPDSRSDSDSDTEPSAAQTESAKAIEETIRFLFGLVGCVGFYDLAVRSMQEGYSLDPAVVYAYAIIIIFLLAGAKGATNILDAWFGGRR